MTDGASHRRRFTTTEARAALLASGRALLMDRGLEAGLGRVTLNDAIETSGVPRASAYRVFSNLDVDPQVAFRLAVLTDLIETVGVDTSVAGDSIGAVDLGTTDDPIELASAFREIIRLWTAANLQVILGDRGMLALDAIAAAVAMDPAPDPPTVDALAASLERSHGAFMPFYEAMQQVFGVKPRPGVNLEQVASMLRAAASTALHEWQLQPRTQTIVRPTGPGGEMQEWTLSGVLAEGIVLTCYMRDPDADVSADISSWVG